MNPQHLAGIEAALDRAGRTHSLGDVIRQVIAGQAQIWETDGALIVTEIHEAPRARVLHFWVATGELDAVVALSEVVLEWGARNGCSQATLAGRKGWERVLAGAGWSPRLTLMGRSIA